MTTYCIDENKNLVNTLALSKQTFTFSFPMTISEDRKRIQGSVSIDTPSFYESLALEPFLVYVSGSIFHGNFTLIPASFTYTDSAGVSQLFLGAMGSGANRDIDVSLIGLGLALVLTITTTNSTFDETYEGDQQLNIVLYYAS